MEIALGQLHEAGPLLSHHPQAHSKAARAVTFAPDGRLLLTASTDRSILAVDAASGKPVARLGDAHESGIDHLTFVSDAVLASGGPLSQLWQGLPAAVLGHSTLSAALNAVGRHCMLEDLCTLPLSAEEGTALSRLWQSAMS